MNEWHFRLDGDEYDVGALRELFVSEVKIITDEQGKSNLVMQLPYTTSESIAAHNIARQLLARLNAIAQVIYGNHENLQIVGIGCKDPSGAPMHLFIQMGSGIRSRARMGGGLTIMNSSSTTEFSSLPARIGDQFLAAADTNDLLERALYLFGSLPLDWRGLYMILEVAEDANGGEAGLIAKRWTPDGQIKRFKATADSYKALGLAARHGSTTKGLEKASITLEESRDMVRTVLEKWVKGVV